MKKLTYIFGHTSPDTDSICSSIAYGELKKALGEPEILVCRLGNINKETKFVLEHFNVPEPIMLNDVKPRLSDIVFYDPVRVKGDCSLLRTWEIMKSTAGHSTIVAIVDEDNKLKGVTSIQDLTKIFMADVYDVLEKYKISYENLIDVIKGNIVTGEVPKQHVGGKFYLDSCAKDLSCEDIVIITDYENIAKFIDRCACLIVPGNIHMKRENFSSAHTLIIETKVSAFEIISGISQAVSIGSLMKSENIEIFHFDNYIEDVIDEMMASRHRNFPVLDSEGRLMGIVTRRHLMNYKRRKVILIDHNESHQSAKGIEQADIVEIIDHHRVANIQTQTPLFIRSEPVGSTATIIFKMYMENFMRPEKDIAGIMLSAILSDTLMFNSPTCTKEDREASYKLAKIAGLDLDEYGELMFTKSAIFDEYTEEEILKIDRKEFSFGKYRAYISQVNTIDFTGITARQDKLLAAMEDFKQKTGCDLVLLMITDIVNNGSEIIGTKVNSDILLRAFNIARDECSIYLPKVVSRKKQIVPLLMKAVEM